MKESILCEVELLFSFWQIGEVVFTLAYGNIVEIKNLIFS